MLGNEPLLLEYACKDCIGGSSLYIDWLCFAFDWFSDLDCSFAVYTFGIELIKFFGIPL